MDHMVRRYYFIFSTPGIDQDDRSLPEVTGYGGQASACCCSTSTITHSPLTWRPPENKAGLFLPVGLADLLGARLCGGHFHVEVLQSHKVLSTLVN